MKLTEENAVNDDHHNGAGSRTMHWCNPAKGRGGFTLVEVVIVLTIVSILSTISLSMFGTVKQQVQEARVMEELRGIEQAISSYLFEKGHLPDSLADLGQGPHLDPWSNPVVYLNHANGGAPRKDVAVINVNTDYDLYSRGADNQSHQLLSHPESADDVLRGGNGTYVGTGARY